MPAKAKEKDIQVEQELDFQRREWKVERIGWVVMAVLMLLALIGITTLVSLDIGLSLIKQRSSRVEKVVDSVPLIIVENGKPIRDRMDKSRIDEEDVLEIARETQGLARLDQVKYAVLERSGKISVIPKES